MNPFVIALTVVGICSVIGSTLVIMTLVLFESMRTRPFMKLITYIAIGEFLGNFPYVVPLRPGAGNWWCSTSAFLNLSGYPMSWLWTTVLTFRLFSVGSELNLVKPTRSIHLVCWLLPIFFALLTLAFSKYAPNNNVDVCSENYSYKVEIYHLITYYGMLVVCLLIMFCMLIYLKYLYCYQSDSSKTSMFSLAMVSLQFYPTSMIVFWVPHLVMVILRAAEHESVVDPTIYYICLIWKVAHGICTAIIFFVQSSTARRLWLQYFNLFTPPDQFTSTTVSVDDLKESDSEIDLDQPLRTSSRTSLRTSLYIEK
jgi:hypothetical protein